eukprot:4910705-Prymnesium_polylepis.1
MREVGAESKRRKGTGMRSVVERCGGVMKNLVEELVYDIRPHAGLLRLPHAAGAGTVHLLWPRAQLPPPQPHRAHLLADRLRHLRDHQHLPSLVAAGFVGSVALDRHRRRLGGRSAGRAARHRHQLTRPIAPHDL